MTHTRPSTELMSLLTRGLMVAAGLVVVERFGEKFSGQYGSWFPDVNLDGEFGIHGFAEKAKFEALAAALSRKTHTASAADMQAALREGALYGNFETMAGMALIKKMLPKMK